MERIDGAIGLLDVSALAARFRDRLDQGDLALDLTGLTGIDTAGLQLLLSTRVEAAACGRAVTLRMPQDGPVAVQIAQLGLEYAFAPTGQAEDPEQEMTQ